MEQMPLYEQQKNRRTGLMFIARGDGLIFYGFHCSLEKHPIISRVSVFLICSPGSLLSPRILQETQSNAHSEPVCSKQGPQFEHSLLGLTPSTIFQYIFRILSILCKLGVLTSQKAYQKHRPSSLTSDLPSQNLHFNNILRQFVCTLKFEKLCFRTLLFGCYLLVVANEHDRILLNSEHL